MKLVSEETTETVNVKTGEVLEMRRQHVVRLPTEPPYVKLYLDDIVKLYALPARTSDVMYALLRQMNFDSIITLTAASKRRIAENLNTSVSTVENQICKLNKADLLQRIDRGEYMLNPLLFARGAWSNIRQLRDKYLELNVTYKNGERVVTGGFKNIKNNKEVQNEDI